MEKYIAKQSQQTQLCKKNTNLKNSEAQHLRLVIILDDLIDRRAKYMTSTKTTVMVTMLTQFKVMKKLKIICGPMKIHSNTAEIYLPIMIHIYSISVSIEKLPINWTDHLLCLIKN